MSKTTAPTTASPADVVDKAHSEAVAQTKAFINLRGKGAIMAWVEKILPNLTPADVSAFAELRQVEDKDGVLQNINQVIARFMGVSAILTLSAYTKSQAESVIKYADRLFATSERIEKFSSEWDSLAQANDVAGLIDLAQSALEADEKPIDVDKRLSSLYRSIIKEGRSPAEARAAVAKSLAKL